MWNETPVTLVTSPKQKRIAESQERLPSEYLIHNLTVNSHVTGVAARKINCIVVCYIESTSIVFAFYLSNRTSLYFKG